MTTIKNKSFLFRALEPLTSKESKQLWRTIKWETYIQVQSLLSENATKSTNTLFCDKKNWLIEKKTQLKAIQKILKKDIAQEKKDEKINKLLRNIYFEELYDILEHKLTNALKKIYEANEELELNNKGLSIVVKPSFEKVCYDLMENDYGKEVCVVTADVILKIKIKIRDLCDEDKADDEPETVETVVNSEVTTPKKSTEAEGTAGEATPIAEVTDAGKQKETAADEKPTEAPKDEVVEPASVEAAQGSEEAPKADTAPKPKGPFKKPNQKAKNTRRK